MCPALQRTTPSAVRRDRPHLWHAAVRILILSLCGYLVALTAASAQQEQPRWSYLEDPSASLTVTDVARRAFEPSNAHFAKGFTRSAHWIRLDAVEASAPMLLSVEIPILDDVRLFSRAPDGTWIEARSGDRIPYSARPWQSPFLGFYLSPQDLAAPLFLRVASSGTNAVTLKLRPLPEGVNAEHRAMLTHAAMFGPQLMTIAVCIVLYLSIRDRIFLFFALAQMTWLTSAFIFYGYASVLFPSRTTDTAYSVMGTASFLVEMAFHLLVIRRFAPAAGLLRVATALVAATIVLVPILWTQDLTLALRVRSGATLVSIVLMVALAATARDATLMPLGLLRAIYWAYFALVSLWIFPLLGFTDAPWLTRHAIVLHSTANLVLIFIIVLRMGMIRHRQAQRAREALSKAELDRLVSAKTIETQTSLIHMLSHEVGTALSVIRYSVAKEPVSARNRKRIDTAISGLDQSVRSLVDADRFVAGDITLQISRVDPIRLMQEIITDQSDSRVSLHGPPGPGAAEVETDPDLLRLALRHLLDNACKYAAEGAHVSVDVRALADGAVGFVFRNPMRSGPAPDLAKLAERYYRDPHVLSLPGTGVGLSVVSDISALLGAELRLSVDGADFVAELRVR